MGSYLPSTPPERQDMLESIGLRRMEELFSQVPEGMRYPALSLPEGCSELEVSRRMRRMAEKNHVFASVFRGAGAYRHYIPSIVKSVTAKEEFRTAYTPYQAEISQGILQSIFEYQTMICELTGLPVSNASVYDGATAAAEAAAMCVERKRNRILVSAGTHPMTLRVIETYYAGTGTEIQVIPLKEGVTDSAALAALLDETAACVCIQQPNYFGCIEDAAALGGCAHGAGAKFIMSVNPIAAAILPSARECGADIAVGEGQPLGMPLSFGGPYLGFMACTDGLMRKLPGRIVGETADHAGNRAFVLTLQAREQHIRREKAASNICSNEALCAMTAAVYLTAMGPDGLQEAARQCYSKAHYAAGQLGSLPGVSLVHSGAFFHEFVTTCPIEPQRLLAFLEERDILGGLPVEDGLLWCVTEQNSREEIDQLVQAVKEVLSTCS